MRELVRAIQPKTFQEAVNAGSQMETEVMRQGSRFHNTKRKWKEEKPYYEYHKTGHIKSNYPNVKKECIEILRITYGKAKKE
ncbi:hypothetical protein L1987_58459 [Smallanthus sonchifolius]|uniref:Uncharacterized protein n=1 Tax=Smallanthus sonchifolius TaxID=185202 RepID=A0ACB9DFT8_9ASTR|nr:hypothetical protein L1987_58459 [Smallanthus sonchifolius]